MDIIISNELKNIYPNVSLGIISYNVRVENSNLELVEYFNKIIKELEERYQLEDIIEIPQVKATREAYKALGKSPSKYRNAAEAMLRRIVKGNGLYKINNVVEINNIISTTSGYSIGSYDREKLNGAIELNKGKNEEEYIGIGKAAVNIENLPVLYDNLGPFGNPTSDSSRTLVQQGEREILSVIYSFLPKNQELNYWLKQYKKLLLNYTNASNISIYIIN